MSARKPVGEKPVATKSAARSKKPAVEKPVKKAASPKKPVAKSVPVDMKARFPAAGEIERKLLDAKVMTDGKPKGKAAAQNGLLSDFAHLLASRPSGARHISRLVVDWTRVVETRMGVGSPLPKTKEGQPLFQVVMAAILPPEVTASAVSAYHALYGV